jgi:hypothetical protein
MTGLIKLITKLCSPLNLLMDVKGWRGDAKCLRGRLLFRCIVADKQFFPLKLLLRYGRVNYTRQHDRINNYPGDKTIDVMDEAAAKFAKITVLEKLPFRTIAGQDAAEGVRRLGINT